MCQIIGMCFFCKGTGECGICEGSGVLPDGFIDRYHNVCECGNQSIFYLGRHYCSECVCGWGLTESYLKIRGIGGLESQHEKQLGAKPTKLRINLKNSNDRAPTLHAKPIDKVPLGLVG